MAAPKKVSVKHLQISKSQSTMLAVIALTTVIVIFGLFATKSLIVKGLYQRRALHAKQDVASVLKTNLSSAQSLFNQYKVFAEQNPNMLGGTIDGNNNLDGDNPRITLDSLPSSYDAPALATSVEKVLTERAVTINALKVTDDPTTNSDTPEGTPKPKSVIFSFEGTTNYPGAQDLLRDFERSIRPFDLNTIEISGSDNKLKLTVGMTTYFQPGKRIDLTPTQVVK